MREIDLPFSVKRPILACGADLKGAFALAKGRSAFLVDGFGDLGDPDNLDAYERAVRRYERELGIKPAIVACDLHPDYFTSRFAANLQLTTYNLKLFKIQHHEAHIASAIIDNSIKGDVIGVAFDGTGFGSDGNIWGGEFFIGGLKDFRRAGHLAYIPMPGSDACVKEPWRMAASYLYRIFGKNFGRADKRRRILKMMIDKKINSPLTSSMGRLFDAVGSIILSKDAARYEAELPIDLEKMAIESVDGSYDFSIRSERGDLVVNVDDVIKGVLNDLSKKVEKMIISTKFHNTIADIILKVAIRLRKKFSINNVVLSGGVFQNEFLRRRALTMLQKRGFKVCAHSRIPVNDSGIPIGQIAIANFKDVTCV